MLAVFALSLLLGSGLVALYVRQTLMMLGFVPPGMKLSFYLVITVAGAYAALQLLFVALMKLYQPTNAPSMLVTETVSHLCTVAFVPYLAHVQIPWPSSSIEKAEPILYLALFGGCHLICKLASFYASLQGGLSRRLGAAGWLGCTIVVAMASVLGARLWLDGVEQAVGTVDEFTKAKLVGYQLAEGRTVLEGAVLSGSIEALEGRSLSLRFANVPSADSEATHLSRAYVTVTMRGAFSEKIYATSVFLDSSSWSEIRVPAQSIPSDIDSYEIYWRRTSTPNWQKILGVRPLVFNLPERPGDAAPSPARLLVSGPYTYQARQKNDRPNFLVILVDGLAANHLAILGYDREVTPALDRLGYGGDVFPNTYAPQGSGSAALGAILSRSDTGEYTTLPELLRERHYATAAFSELGSIGIDEIVARVLPGLEVLDLHNPNATDSGSAQGGSRQTLEKARSWIEAHRDVPFFCLVRLRELEGDGDKERYDVLYPEKEIRTRDVDRYDNALLYMDRQIGALLKYIRDRETRRNTCILITSSYGTNFSLGSKRRKLSEATDRVPLILYVPGGRKRRRSERVTFADIGATIAALAEVDNAGEGGGRNLTR